MATKQELAKNYADKLIKNDFSRESIILIIAEIKNLQYEGSNNTISVADRIEIVNIIKENVKSRIIRKGIRTYSSEGILSEQRSNDDFLDLIDYVLDQVKK